jgi:hypothetical protein
VRSAPLNASRGALFQLLAECGWHKEADILFALSDVPVARVLRALDQGVREGIYRQWLFRGEGCYSDELHYSCAVRLPRCFQ